MLKIEEKIKNTSIGLKLRELKHRFSFKKDYIRMSQAVERFKNCKSKKSGNQIKREMKICQDYWKCYPLHYIRYELYKKDKLLSENELINYIPEFFFYNLFLPFYDTDKFEILLKDKIITENFFRSLNITQPMSLAKLINKQFYTCDLKITNFNTIKKELEANNFKKIFVKPAQGMGGYGIYIFNRNADGEYLTAENISFTEELLMHIGEKDNYLIQPGFEQSAAISKIYPVSVNTFRIATEYIDAKARVVCATLRMGANNNQVDNSAQGGIMIKIDTDSGALADFATNEECKMFYEHPNTGFSYKGYKISDWHSIRKFTEESAAKMPQFTYLGWDIALTSEGPVAIETNLGFGLDHYQIPIGGLREIFKIDNPDFYWKNIKNSSS